MRAATPRTQVGEGEEARKWPEPAAFRRNPLPARGEH